MQKNPNGSKMLKAKTNKNDKTKTKRAKNSKKVRVKKGSKEPQKLERRLTELKSEGEIYDQAMKDYYRTI